MTQPDSKPPRPRSESERAGQLPPDVEASDESLHRRHEEAEAARHEPSETGAGKEGKPSKP